MCSSFELERCSRCEHKTAGCEDKCTGYTLHKKAYEEALRIYNNKSLGVPRGECKDCTKRHATCHSNCWSHILMTEYKHICKEEVNRQRLADSIHHLVGIPGLPYRPKYDKTKHNKFVYPR